MRRKTLQFQDDGMAGVTGLEPATSGVTGRHSNQLSYTPADRGPRADDTVAAK